ncbi:hypothetical protein J4G33_14660 [Actinotalea sp. BY-33]|uniref:Uncharacterized protein n=1 Tax=Actinotalea soli TaxID=2819234 RepID=A0A939LR79_9CELL|nr:hypothetical protein [Actinotalea soli]MBO1753051.1 hypothetical protein [Actinotalea soli]
MRIDLERALEEVAARGRAQARPVPTDGLLRRVHRRRATRTVTSSVAGVGAVGLLAVGGIGLLSPAPVAPPATQAPVAPSPEPSASEEPVASTEVLPGWEPGAAPCGVRFELEPVDSPGLELLGGVTVGALAEEDGLYRVGVGEELLHPAVTAYPETPGEPGGALASLHTYLVDEAGTIALWDPPTEELGSEATNGSGAFNIAGLRDAVDCRTGQPLLGTYRAFSVASPGTGLPDQDEPGIEIVELEPVTFGADAGPADPHRTVSALPRCGDDASSALEAVGDPDFRAELDVGLLVDPVSVAGVHLPVTLRRTDTLDGVPLTGYAPQSVRAILVDDEGRVRTTMEPAYRSAEPLHTAPGDAVQTSLYQWFTCLGGPEAAGLAPQPGEVMDLYVYDQVRATAVYGTRVTATVLGGPYPVTLTDW